ncbi:MAG: hypothetical protein Kow002_05130 [Anaerolineales bacterium]
MPGFSVQEARKLAQAIPSVGISSDRVPIPTVKMLTPGSMISFGTVTSWDLESKASPSATINLEADGVQASMENGARQQSVASVEIGNKAEIIAQGILRITSGYSFSEDGIDVSHGYSISTRLEFGGGDTVSKLVKSAWIENQDVAVNENGEFSEYRVQVKITSIFEE